MFSSKMKSRELSFDKREELLDNLISTGTPYKVSNLYFNTKKIKDALIPSMSTILLLLGVNNIFSYTIHLLTTENSIVYSLIYSVMNVLPTYYKNSRILSFLDRIKIGPNTIIGHGISMLFWAITKFMSSGLWTLDYIKKSVDPTTLNIMVKNIPGLGFSLPFVKSIFPGLPTIIVYLYMISMGSTLLYKGGSLLYNKILNTPKIGMKSYTELVDITITTNKEEDKIL